MKRIFALILVILMLGFTPAYAETVTNSHTVKPQFVQTSEIDNDLSVDGKTLDIYAATVGYSDATRCGVTVTLQKLSGSSWVKYSSWSATSTSSDPNYVAFSRSISVPNGQYRLVTSHSVTVGSYTEYNSMMSATRIVS